jgi:hypothetical protein
MRRSRHEPPPEPRPHRRRRRRFPGIAFNPVVHLNYAETVLPIKDGLPKLKDFPAEVGGSGELVPE